MSDIFYGIVENKKYKQKSDIAMENVMDASVFVNNKSKAYMLLCNPAGRQYDLIAAENISEIAAHSYQDAEILVSDDPDLNGALLFICNLNDTGYKYYDANPTLYDSDIVNGAFYAYDPGRTIQPVVTQYSGHKLYRNGTAIADIASVINSYAASKGAAFFAIDQGTQDDSDLHLPIYKPVPGDWPQPDAYIGTNNLSVMNAIVNKDGSYVINMKGSVLIHIFPWVPVTDDGISKQAWQPQYTVRNYFVSIIDGTVTNYQLDVDQRMINTAPNPTVIYNHQYNASYKWMLNDGYYCNSLTLNIYDAADNLIGNVGGFPKCIAKLGSSYLISTGMDSKIFLLEEGAVTTVYENLINNTRLVKTSKLNKIKKSLEDLFTTIG